MKRAMGAIIGFALFFPGALILKWLVVEELRLYQDMTLTDALLAIIIILASALLFGQPRRPLSAEELERQAQAMELASRRLEDAQRRHSEVRRNRRPAAKTSSASAGESRSPMASRGLRSSDRRRR